MSAKAAVTETEILLELNKKLGVVISLLLRSLTRDSKSLSLKDQIAILDELGVRPIEIAHAVGRKPNHVAKELVAIRRGAKK